MLKATEGQTTVATIDESGIKDFEVLSWFGLYGSAQLPTAALARITAEVAAALRTPEIDPRFAKLGVARGDLSQAAFVRFVDDEIDKWGHHQSRQNSQAVCAILGLCLTHP
jgi:tripartite-type tricarboxylate transporter receptor subunit TctC